MNQKSNKPHKVACWILLQNSSRRCNNTGKGPNTQYSFFFFFFFETAYLFKFTCTFTKQNKKTKLTLNELIASLLTLDHKIKIFLLDRWSYHAASLHNRRQRSYWWAPAWHLHTSAVTGHVNCGVQPWLTKVQTLPNKNCPASTTKIVSNYSTGINHLFSQHTSF